jgi:peptidyl-prolyl cis-trans isomerase NIMA-interacting 1
MRKYPSLLASLVLLTGCPSLVTPSESEGDFRPSPPAAAAQPRPAVSLVQAVAPPRAEEVRASHILVAYQGARGAQQAVTRTKDQAKKRAEDVLKSAQDRGDFAALAREYSDDPGSGPRGGELGSFTRTQMVKPFADAAFALRPGQVSDLVETDFGFHIIKRAP